MAFELWSIATKNLVGDFATEAEALAAVRAAAQAHGTAYVDDLLLARETSRGATRMLARGAELCERAFAAVPSPLVYRSERGSARPSVRGHGPGDTAGDIATKMAAKTARAARPKAKPAAAHER